MTTDPANAPIFGWVRSYWLSEDVGVAGDNFKAALDVVETNIDTVVQYGLPSTESWRSDGAQRSAARIHAELTAFLSPHLEGARGVQRAIYAAETSVAEIERLVADLETAASTAQFDIDNDGNLTDLAGQPTFATQEEADAYTAERDALATDLAEDIAAILTLAIQVQTDIDAALPDVGGGVDDDGEVPPEVAAAWAELTPEEQEAVLVEIGEEIAEEYGIEPPPTVLIETPNNADANASYAAESNTVRINPEILDDPHALNSIAHEMRHALQHYVVNQYQQLSDDAQQDAIDGTSDPFERYETATAEVIEWQQDQDDDLPDDGPYDDYYGQPTEIDARAAGDDYADQLTLEELQRILEESAA